MLQGFWAQRPYTILSLREAHHTCSQASGTDHGRVADDLEVGGSKSDKPDEVSAFKVAISRTRGKHDSKTVPWGV